MRVAVRHAGQERDVGVGLQGFVLQAEDGLDGVVLDIGVSSMQIDEAERGFSFQKDGPLDMRMSGEGVSAADVVNRAKVGDMIWIFSFLGV